MTPGTVVLYTPDPSRFEPRWCREGIAIADGKGVLFDTYWDGHDEHCLNKIEVESAEVLFHLDDFDELDRYSQSSKSTWATYHSDDRKRITSQHGLQSRWFVRKGATPDLSTQIENAQEAVDSAKGKVRSDERSLQWAEQELQRLLDTQICEPCGKPISQADLDNDVAHFPHDELCQNDEQGGEFCSCERKPVHGYCCWQCK